MQGVCTVTGDKTFQLKLFIRLLDPIMLFFFIFDNQPCGHVHSTAQSG